MNIPASADLAEALNRLVSAMNVQSEEQKKLAEEQRKRDEKLAEEQRKRDEKLFSCLGESKTDCQSMSKASNQFATSLIRSLGISWTHAPSNNTPGVECVFSWEKGEDKETSNAVEYLKRRGSHCSRGGNRRSGSPGCPYFAS